MLFFYKKVYFIYYLFITLQKYFLYMKFSVLSVATLLTLVSCQDKTVYIDNTKLLNDYQEKKDLEAALQQKIDAYSKKRDSISRTFQMEAQLFESQAQGLAPAVAQKKYNELMQKSQILQQDLMQEERNIQAESQTKMDSLLTKVKKFVKEYGKNKGYTFILGANEGGSVLYGADEKNITDEVVKALNEKYKK